MAKQSSSSLFLFLSVFLFFEERRGTREGSVSCHRGLMKLLPLLLLLLLPLTNIRFAQRATAPRHDRPHGGNRATSQRRWPHCWLPWRSSAASARYSPFYIQPETSILYTIWYLAPIPLIPAISGPHAFKVHRESCPASGGGGGDPVDAAVLGCCLTPRHSVLALRIAGAVTPLPSRRCQLTRSSCRHLIPPARSLSLRSLHRQGPPAAVPGALNRRVVLTPKHTLAREVWVAHMLRDYYSRMRILTAR